MKSNRITKLLIPLCIAAAVSVPTQASESNSPPTPNEASAKETGGFGAGLIVGAILGGPPGAIIGAASGSWLGHHDTQRTDAIAAKSSELSQKENQITKLQTELSVTESELANTINRLKTDRRLATMDFLKNGLTTTVYFRSGEVDLPVQNADKLYQLARLLKDFPELHVQMEGHTDIRGDIEYNQHLSEMRIETVQSVLEDAGLPAERIHCESHGESQAMATEGDNENYVFDRRVSIHVSLAAST